jgi:hypothetical protein
VRQTVIPQTLNGLPFRTARRGCARAVVKTLQGSRFRRIAKGVYVAATSDESLRIQVQGIMIRRRRTTLARLQSAVQGYSGRGGSQPVPR